MCKSGRTLVLVRNLDFTEGARNPWRVQGLTSFKAIIVAAKWETQGRVRREGKGDSREERSLWQKFQMLGI